MTCVRKKVTWKRPHTSKQCKTKAIARRTSNTVWKSMRSYCWVRERAWDSKHLENLSPGGHSLNTLCFNVHSIHFLLACDMRHSSMCVCFHSNVFLVLYYCLQICYVCVWVCVYVCFACFSMRAHPKYNSMLLKFTCVVCCFSLLTLFLFVLFSCFTLVLYRDSWLMTFMWTCAWLTRDSGKIEIVWLMREQS